MFVRIAAAAITIVPKIAGAHSFVEPYLLPIPFWLYVYGCAATLVVTFALLGYFAGSSDAGVLARRWQVTSGATLNPVGRWLLWSLRAVALASLLLTIVAGVIGTADPLSNIGMQMFWIVFLLGFTYVTIFAGDVYALVNPWETIVMGIERVMPNFTRGRVSYPHDLGYYPAFAFYLALIWIELFVLPKPVTLATALVTYTLLTLLAVFAFGRSAWFRYGEMFAVFFRLVALMAPLEYTPAGGPDRWKMRVRFPFTAAADARPNHAGLVLFILFMLSSTTYDAMHETDLWVGFYWHYLIVLAQPLWGTDMVNAQHVLMPWYDVYQRTGLLLSPFAYLALYAVMLYCAKRITKSTIPLRQLALDFAPSLIPIAVVYNVTHYYTMLISQLGKFGRVATDPFGFGWNLFGLGVRESPPPLDMGLIWHTQVALILVGHVASVYLAHVTAVRVFPTRRQAILCQLPLLVLMVAYTAFGLFILSMPLAAPTYVE